MACSLIFGSKRSLIIQTIVIRQGHRSSYAQNNEAIECEQAALTILDMEGARSSTLEVAMCNWDRLRAGKGGTPL
jgi:hypothetical protein